MSHGIRGPDSIAELAPAGGTPEFSGRDAGFVPVAVWPGLRSEAHLVYSATT